MLPRKRYRRALCLSIATTFLASTIAAAPVRAISGYEPDVTVKEINVTPRAGISTLNTGLRTTSLLPTRTVTPFTLVGLTWVGPVATGTEFKVRVRESGVWSTWFELEYGEYQGVGKDGIESVDTRVGSDPLLTGLADGVEVIMKNSTGAVPAEMKVTLVNSQVTKQDRNIAKQSIRLANTDSVLQSQTVAAQAGASVSPQGALVARPRIISRAEWGANESWRNSAPKIGTTLLAGIVHHTASTNNYTAEQAPAQMRNLYAYFTKSLKYSDMGYNFLVDKYGTIYEGRSGCAVKSVNCDGPTIPVQGAHTAGLNKDTFGVSAIGNYDVLAPVNPDAMVESIASLMAWKLAPYGLDPNATAKIMSTDRSGSSKYRAGQTAITPVISAHRDVGKTACPGRYLYPYMDDIRARATTLLTPLIQDMKVSPKYIDSNDVSAINVSATIPATAEWTVEVKNADNGLQIMSKSGSQVTSGKVTFAWDRKDNSGALVAMGRYAVTVSASVQGVLLPPRTTVVAIASLPSPATDLKFIRSSMTNTKVSWASDSSNPAPVTANYIRISSDDGKSWSNWKKTRKQSFSRTWKKGKKYLVEVKSINALGESAVTRASYKVKKFAPPKPAAVTEVKFKQLSNDRVTVSWSPAVTEYETSGFYYRVAKDGAKYGKWTKSSAMKTAVTLNEWKKNSKYKIQVKVRNISGYSPAVTSTFTSR
jgi:hypothetical protein